MTEQRVADFIPALVDSDEGVRRYGRRLLGIDDEAGVAPFLVESLTNAADRVRRSAVGALGRLVGGDLAITALERALDDEHASVREAAGSALERLQQARHDGWSLSDGEGNDVE